MAIAAFATLLTKFPDGRDRVKTGSGLRPGGTLWK